MEYIHLFVDFILHLDKHLAALVQQYGTLTYVILFLIVFTETGLIVMPLLPGDSLLFAVGALAAVSGGVLDVKVSIPLLIAAALCGDHVNYFAGKYFSSFVKKRERILFFKREYLEQTEAFYAKYGGATVVIARFMPIVRTIAPFVAGAGSMRYARYVAFCIGGAVLWVTSITLLGFYFGNIPWVKQNFEVVVFAIIGISVLPIVWQLIKTQLKR